MKIGFTGTRKGMTLAQREEFRKLIAQLTGPDFCRDAEFHHGDCVGADDEAATYAHESGFYSVVCHPPVDESLRAFNPFATFTTEPKTHFARNRDIVNEADVLIACPCDMSDQPKGGTWYTIGYAKKKGKPTYIIWPDGRVELRRMQEMKGTP